MLAEEQMQLSEGDLWEQKKILILPKVAANKNYIWF